MKTRVKLAEDATARFGIPLESRLWPGVTGPTRSFLTLYSLPAPAIRFITGRLDKALQKLAGVPANAPVRVLVTLRKRKQEIRVDLRVAKRPSIARRLAPLARGAPESVRVTYRPGRREATLSFVFAGPVRG